MLWKTSGTPSLPGAIYRPVKEKLEVVLVVVVVVVIYTDWFILELKCASLMQSLI